MYLFLRYSPHRIFLVYNFNFSQPSTIKIDCTISKPFVYIIMSLKFINKTASL